MHYSCHSHVHACTTAPARCSLVGHAAVDAGRSHGAGQAVRGDVAALASLLVAARKLQQAGRMETKLRGW